MFADTVRMAHRMNGTIASMLGLAANLTLFIFILKSDTKAFRKVLVQIAIIDFIFLVVGAVSEPMIVFIEGTEIILQNGYMRYIPQPWNGYMISAWIFGMYFSISSISMQFLYRYLIICHQMEPSGKKFMALLSFPVAISLGISMLIQFGYVITPEKDKYATEVLKDWLLESGQKSVFASSVCMKGSVAMIAVGAYVISVITVNYAIIIFCIIKIRIALKRTQFTMSKENRRLQHQLTWAYGIQALSPLFVSFGPLAFLGYTIIIEGTAFWSMIWFTTGFSWVPFCNAAMTLLIVDEFRQKLLGCHRLSTVYTSNPMSYPTSNNSLKPFCSL